ncbi:uncharacterized protein LOC129755831 [Uranotaenia lowii]|uniref:uncharacterized protein LOC129755831 n=1 Tax=Uranotaenia lowii TaxID=190385 RepID=UPI002479DC75|nr:uncharacterized protein LOC129755831 [Uranotaenia lowii]
MSFIGLLASKHLKSLTTFKNVHCTGHLATRLRFQPISTTQTVSAAPRTMRAERYRIRDRVPEAFDIIYRAPMEYYLSACNIITSFSFVAFTGIASYTYLVNYNAVAVPFDIEFGNLTANENDLALFLGFFLLANVAIRMLVNRYALRIYRHDEKYIAIFEGNLPLTRRQYEFKKGDVVPVPEGGVLPWQDARYKINDKSVLILEHHFRTPAEFNAMLKSN